MVFASLFFIYAFFALNLIFYMIVRTEDIYFRNGVMLVFSLIFYAFVGPKYILLLVGETLISYICALGISKTENGGRKLFLALDVILLLGLLGYFKYAGFLVTNFNLLPFPDLKVPQVASVVGISFYTFQLISYTVDVFRKEVKPQKNFLRLLLYTSMFHQCIAGPIVRYSTVQKELRSRTADSTDLYEGILRFSTGLAKKAILANGVASVAKSLLPEGVAAMQTTPPANIALGIFCFTLQIYLDFSAYSDMAIGMGRMLGFHYPENFNYPYTAVSVTDFWRRWHISLSSFFRDYVYIPLGGNRKGLVITILNLFVVWFLTGMWHGASWNFILWGLYYFVILVIEKCIRSAIKKSASKKNSVVLETAEGTVVLSGESSDSHSSEKDSAPLPLRCLGHVYTMILVIIGWGIFYFEDLSLLKAASKSMLLSGKWNLIHNAHDLIANLYNDHMLITLKSNLILLIVAILACFPIWTGFRKLIEKAGKKNSAFTALGGIIDITVMILCMLLATIALAGNTYNPFLYFRF